MNFDLAETKEPIRGRFWFPGGEKTKFDGTLYLEAGRSARLETSTFNYAGITNLFPATLAAASSKSKAVTNDLFETEARRIIFGHDEHAKPITLINCLAGNRHATMAMQSHHFECSAALFGTHLDADSLRFDGVRFHFDHLDTWVGRRFFKGYSEEQPDNAEEENYLKIVIQVPRKLEIPLSLPGYSKSEFFSSWSMKPGGSEFALKSRFYLDLEFQKRLEWTDVIQELNRWRWFFSLATRSPIDVREFAVCRNDLRIPLGEEPMETLPVWVDREFSNGPTKSKHAEMDFYFGYNDVGSDFPSIIGNWIRIQKSWAPVLHRFFAVSQPRQLWINESFLFIAQAIEALHRVRSGSNSGKVDLNQAAKNAYLRAPLGLQTLLGDRKVFTEQFRKTRNYWTHYGEPTPATDPHVLEDIPLHDFNQKLRWIVESAILEEIGVPGSCVSKVWNSRWRTELVKYE